MREFDVPHDIAAWMVLWEASIRDADNDLLAQVAGDVLMDILQDRGVSPCGRQRRDLTRPPP